MDLLSEKKKFKVYVQAVLTFIINIVNDDQEIKTKRSF